MDFWVSLVGSGRVLVYGGFYHLFDFIHELKVMLNVIFDPWSILKDSRHSSKWIIMWSGRSKGVVCP